MPYIYLIIAISTEVIGSAFLKSSEGFSKFIPSLGRFCCKVEFIV
ncbi:multidrug resistance efflux protein QacC [Staphylococcus aureus]|nr:multidrug resistance efflux protein QacC [Staphylococcus aureus]